jgi:hypothetical protein
MLNNGFDLLNTVEQLVLKVLDSNRLLTGNWHLGSVDQIISAGKLKVFVDGSDTSQTVSCDPDKTFSQGDHVWVVFINGNPRDKFVISKRAVGV